MLFSVGDNVRPKQLHANEGLPHGRVDEAEPHGGGQKLRVAGRWTWHPAGHFELDPEKGKAG